MMKKQKRYDTDAIALKLTASLLKDLELETEFMGNPREWTMQWWPLDSHEFKRHYQVTNFLAKYIFGFEDGSKYDEETVDKFSTIQESLRSHDYSYNHDKTLVNVIMYARGFLQETLKEYDLDEHLDLCYFPKKASTLNSRANSTLCAKWTEGLSGSRDHIEWFTHVYKRWHGHCLNKTIGTPQEVTALQASLVAKRWNKRRMICPNTSTGGLYTNGLGKVYERRLRDAGYNLQTLPDIHKKLACKASISNDLATVDQRSASDYISVRLFELLFPRRWVIATLKGRLPTIEIGERTINCDTLGTMGIGFTFPVQTLLFLSLAKGCLLHYEEGGRKVRNRTISCFGDDLIIPSELKGLLLRVFEVLHLHVNEEKSFFHGPFRESCGGDYHNGCDVRPAFLPVGGKLTRNEYLSFLYKTFNLLRKRWDKYEIWSTLNEILNEIRMIKKHIIHIVPPSFSDDAGLQVELSELQEFGLVRPSVVESSIKFYRLEKIPNRMEAGDDEYYYWFSLQHSRRYWDASHDECTNGDIQSAMDKLYSNYTPILQQEIADVQPKNYRSKITGKKLKRTYSTVVRQDDSSSTRQTEAIVSAWI